MRFGCRNPRARIDLPAAVCASPDFEDHTVNELRTERTNTDTAATWTDGPWPFTIEGGEPVCIASADEARAIADPEPIWRNDPDLVSAKVNVSPTTLCALKLC